MTAYFGEDWGAPVTEGATRVPTPVGHPCALCEEAIVDGDGGTFIGMVTPVALFGTDMTCTPTVATRRRPVHKECSLREVMGGIGHLLNHRQWCVERGDPDAGLSLRRSSMLVWSYVQDQDGGM